MLWSSFMLAMNEIRRNALRSFLTILGIVIGVAAVIVMVTVGGGATVQVTEQIKSLGSNLLILSPGRRMGPAQSGIPLFSMNDAEAITREIAAARVVAPASMRSMTAIYGNENWSTTVVGSDNSLLQVRNMQIAAGRAFSASELRSGAAACLLGATVRAKLFGAQDPLGAKIRLQSVSCEVIGVMESKGQSVFGQDQDDFVGIPLRTFQRRIAGNQDVGMIQISLADGTQTDKAIADIERLMRERRHIVANEEDNFGVMDTRELTRMLTGTTQVLTTLLGAVAAVSLLVGGIGIMNIMLVSVTERTREIGIRLAIGALEREVLLQFLVEAVVLASFGGLLGIALAIGTSIALADALKVPFIFNPGIVAVAFFFSSAVGIVFGYFPARKAARLDPIEALRHE
jgi:putative ABC transport system permease protein